LVKEVLDFLPQGEGKIIVDGTLGTGGHTLAIMEHFPQTTRVLGIDRDPESLVCARERLKSFAERVTLIQGTFGDLANCCSQVGIRKVDGILLDLGFSSYQLAATGRGFSFQRSEPLDMRMDQSQGHTAREWLRQVDERTLADWLFAYGEERRSRRIAREIISSRQRQPLEDTQDLVAAVLRAIPPRWREKRLHPATRTFQALRILVNDELNQLRQFLEGFIHLLAAGGRVCVISYHSLEDRLVKQAFQSLEREFRTLAESANATVPPSPPFRRLIRKPVTPSREEVLNNPRARGAKLRVGERFEYE
jgi:16S rRNA (cytosine1402-N4)-methyltransferase